MVPWRDLRLAATEPYLRRAARVCAAVGLPVSDSWAEKLFQYLDRDGVMGRYVMVVGTDAMPAYQIEAQQQLPTRMYATRDTVLAWRGHAAGGGPVLWPAIRELGNTESLTQGTNMAILYLLVAGLVVWAAYKLFTKPQAASSSQKDSEDQARITLTVSQVGGATRRSGHDKDRDEWEGSFWEVSQPLPAKAKLRLAYTDGAGQKTERTVDVRQFGAFGDSVLLIGHCNMRNETRTFRSDRISSCIDEETGELVNDVRGYLQAKYDASPDRTKDLLLVDEYDTLRVLLYVGKADGQLRAAEKAVIRETCVALTSDSRLTDKSIDELFTGMDVPTLQAFKLAVGRLSKREAAAQAVVMAAAEKMVATQKVVHASEQEALSYMRKRFAGNAGVA